MVKAKDMNGQGQEPRAQVFQIRVDRLSIIFKRESAEDIAFS